MPYIQFKYVHNIVVNGMRSQTDSLREMHMYNGITLITICVINNFLLNVVWDIIPPKILFYTKPMTSAI